jgi:hypothetical protein
VNNVPKIGDKFNHPDFSNAVGIILALVRGSNYDRPEDYQEEQDPPGTLPGVKSNLPGAILRIVQNEVRFE